MPTVKKLGVLPAQPGVGSRLWGYHTRLARLMRERGMRVNQAAKILGVSDRTMHRYFAHQATIPPWRLAPLCAAMGCPPHQLVDDYGRLIVEG